MSRTRTLIQLRGDVCDRADVVEGSRHTTAALNRRINQSIQRYQRLLADLGCPRALKYSPYTMSTSTTVGADNIAPNSYILLPSDYYHLVGIDVTFGSTTLALLPSEEFERNQFRDSPSWLAFSGLGMPVYYREGLALAAGAAVRVFPSADQAYQMTVIYVPKATELVADGDTFDGIAGYEEWIVNRAALDCLAHDRQQDQPSYAGIMAENDQLQREMALQWASSARRVNTQAMRDRLSRYTRGDYRQW